MLATYPSMSECYYMMGRVYEKMEEHTTAILVIEKAVSLVKRGNRLEVNIIDLFTSLYDNYVALSPPDHHGRTSNSSSTTITSSSTSRR